MLSVFFAPPETKPGKEQADTVWTNGQWGPSSVLVYLRFMVTSIPTLGVCLLTMNEKGQRNG